MANRSPIAPVFIVEGHDVGIFGSVEAAQNQLEPPDVSERIFTGYDARGRLLRIETDGRDTHISLAEDEPSSTADLEGELRSFLSEHLGDARAKEDCDLPCLVELAKDHVERR